MTTGGSDLSAGEAARIATFAALGVLGTANEVAGIILGDIQDADPELVAEETLCLVSLLSARAAEVGLSERLDLAAAVVPALQELPFTYRDYLIGGMMLQNPEAVDADLDESVYSRLRRKASFYDVHFPRATFPGERLLADKLPLWMGRISPPSLPEMPDKRLTRLEVAPAFLLQAKLVLTFCRQVAAG